MQSHQRFAARYGIAAVRSPRFPNMRNRRIVVHTREMVWNDNGEYAADSYRQERETRTEIIGCEPDQYDHSEGNYTAVHMAAFRLEQHYVWQDDASSDPFVPGDWYMTNDEDPYENRNTERSYHLYGFAPSEAARVHRMLRSVRKQNASD